MKYIYIYKFVISLYFLVLLLVKYFNMATGINMPCKMAILFVCFAKIVKYLFTRRIRECNFRNVIGLGM